MRLILVFAAGLAAAPIGCGDSRSAFDGLWTGDSTTTTGPNASDTRTSTGTEVQISSATAGNEIIVTSASINTGVGYLATLGGSAALSPSGVGFTFVNADASTTSCGLTSSITVSGGTGSLVGSTLSFTLDLTFLVTSDGGPNSTSTTTFTFKGTRD
jgi:hypothetical protein